MVLPLESSRRIQMRERVIFRMIESIVRQSNRTEQEKNDLLIELLIKDIVPRWLPAYRSDQESILEFLYMFYNVTDSEQSRDVLAAVEYLFEDELGDTVQPAYTLNEMLADPVGTKLYKYYSVGESDKCVGSNKPHRTKEECSLAYSRYLSDKERW